MFPAWILLNRKGHSHPISESSKALVWRTCLRQVAIFAEDAQMPELLPTDEVFRGQKAYQYLLEIICGLHSPLAAETEVFGQFKDFFSQIDWSVRSENLFFKEIALQILTDAKKVRTQYLKGLGSQSYGSLARRWLSKEENIHIVGGGRLTQDILPWLLKARHVVSIYVRDPKKVYTSEWFKAYQSKVKVFSFSQTTPDKGGVLVCAPVESAELKEWMGESEISRILDLRGESEQDPIQGRWKVQGLRQAFTQIESNKGQIQTQSQKALQAIQSLANELEKTQKVRPFGWDDICA